MRFACAAAFTGEKSSRINYINLFHQARSTEKSPRKIIASAIVGESKTFASKVGRHNQSAFHSIRSRVIFADLWRTCVFSKARSQLFRISPWDSILWPREHPFPTFPTNRVNSVFSRLDGSWLCHFKQGNRSLSRDRSG